MRDLVDKPNRVPQIYGYTVCLVAVVTLLISANNLVQNAFTLANPLQGGQSRFGGEPSITSYEAYRATYERERSGPERAPGPDTTSEATMRTRYEALRADRIERARFEALRSVTGSILLLALSIALFTLHWRWLRAKERKERIADG